MERVILVRHIATLINIALLSFYSRKELSELSSLTPSTMLSRVGMKLGARWQFCSSTQLPICLASSMAACALGPCP